MARIISSLLQRPHVDKAKRAVRIPVGGHTEETLARSLPEVVSAAPEVEAPRIGDELIVNDLFAIIARQEVEVLAAADPVQVEVLEVVVPTLDEVIVVPEVVISDEALEVRAVQQEILKRVIGDVEEIVPDVEVAEEITEGEKVELLDLVKFLSQKPGEIKAALATGQFDAHISELLAEENKDTPRSTVVKYLTARIPV